MQSPHHVCCHPPAAALAASAESFVGLAHVSDYAEKVKGISAPEAVAGVTAHPALDKACHYLKVKLVKVPVDPATQRCVWCMSVSSSV